jgi:hypothetical protein
VKVAIHQPHYLPWLGYLAKWAEADLFVFLDTVQFAKNGWQNRNRINTPDGPRWLTVPVRARLGMTLTEVPLDTGQDWARRHLRAVEHAYARASYFRDWAPALAEFYDTRWKILAPLAVASASWLARALGITVPARLASEVSVPTTDPTGRLVALCRAVGATVYLAGRDGARYMDLAQFRAAGIEVRAQEYNHPVYAQPRGEFVPFLSALDLLLTHGDEALAILRKGDRWFRLDA